jgi:hypothetical protein
VSAPKFQALVWAGLIASAITVTCLGFALPALALLLAALLLPRLKKGAGDENSTCSD